MSGTGPRARERKKESKMTGREGETVKRGKRRRGKRERESEGGGGEVVQIHYFTSTQNPPPSL